VESLAAAPPEIQKACLKQLKFLVRDLHHPSLRAKKYDESRGIWQGRVNEDRRFYFGIRDKCYEIDALIPDPK
jgi:hypothetical protein